MAKSCVLPMPKGSLPDNCCGVCEFGQYEKTKALDKKFYCWESPPIPIVDEGVIDFQRGFEVGTKDPSCRNFKPRCHG